MSESKGKEEETSSTAGGSSLVDLSNLDMDLDEDLGGDALSANLSTLMETLTSSRFQQGNMGGFGGKGFLNVSETEVEKDSEMGKALETLSLASDPTETLLHIQSHFEQSALQPSMKENERKRPREEKSREKDDQQKKECDAREDQSDSKETPNESGDKVEQEHKRLFSLLSRSILVLLSRNDSFSDLVMDQILMHLKFCIDVFSRFLLCSNGIADTAELFEIPNTIVSLTLAGDLFNHHHNNNGGSNGNFHRDSSGDGDDTDSQVKAFLQENPTCLDKETELLSNIAPELQKAIHKRAKKLSSSDSKSENSSETGSEDRRKIRLSLAFLLVVDWLLESKCVERMADLMMSVSERKEHGLSPHRVQIFLQIIAKIVDVLRPEVVVTVAGQLVAALQVYFKSIGNRELKRLERVMFIDIFHQLHVILCKADMPAQKLREATQEMRLCVALKQLKCPYMQQRLAGLKEVRNLVEETERKMSVEAHLGRRGSGSNSLSSSPPTMHSAALSRKRTLLHGSHGSQEPSSPAGMRNKRKRTSAGQAEDSALQGVNANEEEDDSTTKGEEHDDVDSPKNLDIEINSNAGLTEMEVASKNGSEAGSERGSRSSPSPSLDPLADHGEHPPRPLKRETGGGTTNGGDDTDNESTAPAYNGNEDVEDGVEDDVYPDHELEEDEEEAEEEVVATDDEALEETKRGRKAVRDGTNKQPTSVKVSPIASMKTTSRLSLRRTSQEQLWLESKGLCDWFKENKFVSVLFSPESLHTELLKRTTEIFRFLATEELLEEDDLAMIWDTASSVGTHESIRDTVFALIADLAKYLNKKSIDSLWAKIQSLPLEEHDSKTLLLVRTFTVNTLTSSTWRTRLSEADSPPSHQWYGLHLFWQVIQDDSPCSAQAHKLALQYLSDLCAWQPCLSSREHFLLLCIENLQACVCVPQSLKLFRRIITSYPIEISPKTQDSSSTNHSPSDPTPALSSGESLLELAKRAVQDKQVSRKVLSQWHNLLIDACLAELKCYKADACSVVLRSSSLKSSCLLAPEVLRNTCSPVVGTDSTLAGTTRVERGEKQESSPSDVMNAAKENLLRDEDLDDDEYECEYIEAEEKEDDEESEEGDVNEEESRDHISKNGNGTKEKKKSCGISCTTDPASSQGGGSPCSTKKVKSNDSNLIDSIRLVGKYSHLRGIRVRLNFLRFVILSADCQVQLSTEQVHTILESLGRLALSQEERKLALSWLMQIHYVANGFSTETARKALLKWFREFSLASVQPKAFAFFNYLFLVVNAEKGLIAFPKSGKPKPFAGAHVDSSSLETSSAWTSDSTPLKRGSTKTTGKGDGSEEFKVLQPHLYGSGMLWSLALRASNVGVSRKAARLLCKLYLSIPPEVDPECPLNRKKMNNEETDMIAGTWPGKQGLVVGGFVREAMAQLKLGLEEYNLSGTVQLVVRCLSLLKHLQSKPGEQHQLQQEKSQDDDKVEKENTSVTHGWLVKRTNRAAGILLSSELLTIRIKPIDGREFPLKVFKDIQLTTLRAMIAKNLNSEPEFIRLISDGKEIKVSATPEADASSSPLYDGQFVHVVLRPSKSTASSPPTKPPLESSGPPEQGKREEPSESVKTTSTMQPAPSEKKKQAIHPSPKRVGPGAATLLREKENVQLLSELIFNKTPNELLATHTWSLLRDVPTNSSIFASIKNLTLPWDDLLQAESMYKLLYTLEIMHYLVWCMNEPELGTLVLSMDESNSNTPLTASDAQTWSENVVKHGGLVRLIQVLENVQNEKSLLCTHPLGRQVILLLVSNITMLVKNPNTTKQTLEIISSHGRTLNKSLLQCVRRIAVEETEQQDVDYVTVREGEGDGGLLASLEKDIVEHSMALRIFVSKLVQVEAGSVTETARCFSFPDSEDAEFQTSLEWLHDCLLVCRKETVRQSVISALETPVHTHKSLLKALFSIIERSHTQAVVWRSKQFFELIVAMIKNDAVPKDQLCKPSEEDASDASSPFYPQDVFLILLEQLRRHPCYEKHGSSEGGSPVAYDQTLNGLLHALIAILSSGLERVQVDLREFALGLGVVEFVFNTCLFDASEPSSSNEPDKPLCRSTQCRKSACELLFHLTDYSPDNVVILLDLITTQHKQTELPPRILNSILNHASMPMSRSLVYTEASSLSSSAESSCPKDKLRDRERLWHYAPTTQSKADCGYVGLRNLGCTCYMNSLLQHLFMIPELRLALFSVKESKKRKRGDAKEDYSSVKAEAKEEEKARLDKQEKVQVLLHQVQRMFCYLQESEKRFYDMAGFCSQSVVLNYNKPVDIFEQQDVDEFFNVFMDHLESALERTDQSNILRDLFGGVLCNQILCKEGCKHKSEREEKFMVCQLEVKGKASVKESLDLYVEGEMLEGDNKYLCGECNEKRDAQKRACFAKLPKVLILHLKRFEFDLELLRKIKVNDLCEFPMELDMRKYTREGLDDDMDGDSSLTEEDYLYELAGVLVHTGTADSGHYYSYIKERFPINGREDCEWFCFNDEQVSPFDTSSIAQTCFGGLDYNMRWDPTLNKQVQQWTSKPFSAYLLIYERKSMRRDLAHLPATLKNAVPLNLRTACWEENIEFLKDEHVYNPLYSEFVLKTVNEALKLCSVLQTAQGQSETVATIHQSALRAVSSYALNTAVHGKDKGPFLGALKTLRALHDVLPAQSRRILLEIFEANGGTLVKQLLLRCPILSVREEASNLLLPLLVDDLDGERTHYSEFDQAFFEGSYLGTTIYELGELQANVPGRVIRDGLIDRLVPGVELGPLAESSIVSSSKLGACLWRCCLDIPCVPPVKSNVARCVGWMLAYVTEAELHWKHIGPFFQILSRFAEAGPKERRLLVRLGAIPRLLDFFLSVDSPSTKTKGQIRSNPVDFRNGMGDKFASPQLEWAICLLRQLVVHCRVPSEGTGQQQQQQQQQDSPDEETRPMEMDGDEPHELETTETVSSSTSLDGEEVASTIDGSDQLTFLDLHLMLHVQFFSKIFESVSSASDVALICRHISKEQPTISSLVIISLIQLLPDLGNSSIQSVFRCLEKILEIDDKFHEQRVKLVLNELFRILREECGKEAVVTSLQNLSTLLANKRLTKMAHWFLGQKISFWHEYVILADSVMTRRNAASLCLKVCYLATEKATTEADGKKVLSDDSTEKGDKPREILHEEQALLQGPRNQILSGVLDFFVSGNEHLKRHCSTNHYEDLETSLSKLPRPPLVSNQWRSTLAAKEENKKGAMDATMILEEFATSPPEPSPYHLVSAARLCRALLNLVGTDKGFVSWEHVEGLLEAIVAIDKHKLECDWNKGELIVLLKHILTMHPHFVKKVVEHEHLEAMLNISMTVRPSDEHNDYNELYAPAYYEFYSLVLVESGMTGELAERFSNLHHLKWAMRYFLLDVFDYERTSRPLYFLARAVMASSFTFRQTMLKLMFYSGEYVHHFKLGALKRRINILRHALEIGVDLAVDEDEPRAAVVVSLREQLKEESGDAYEGMLHSLTFEFFSAGGMKFLSSLVRNSIASLASAVQLATDKYAQLTKLTNGLYATFVVLKHAITWLHKTAQELGGDSVDDTGDPKSSDSYKELTNGWDDHGDLLADVMNFSTKAVATGEARVLDVVCECISVLIDLVRARGPKSARLHAWNSAVQPLLAFHQGRGSVLVSKWESTAGEEKRQGDDSDEGFEKMFFGDSLQPLPARYVETLNKMLLFVVEHTVEAEPCVRAVLLAVKLFGLVSIETIPSRVSHEIVAGSLVSLLSKSEQLKGWYVQNSACLAYVQMLEKFPVLKQRLMDTGGSSEALVNLLEAYVNSGEEEKVPHGGGGVTSGEMENLTTQSHKKDTDK